MVTQTWEPDEVNFIDNYVAVLRILLGRMEPVGIDPRLVWEHFGEPDVWQLGAIYIPAPDGEMRRLAPELMFSFITLP